MAGSKEDSEHWGRTAQTYDTEYRRYVGEALENEIRSWLVQQFTASDEVLELGCGTGIFSAMIADRVKRLTATDLSPEMLEQAKRRLGDYDNVQVQKEDAYGTSFADDSFNAVLAVNLLHHAHAPAAVARECRRVLTPGGKLVVVDCTGHGASLLSLILMSLRYLRRWGRPPKTGHSFSSHDELAALIVDADLAVQETALLAQRRPRMKFTCLRAKNPD